MNWNKDLKSVITPFGQTSIWIKIAIALSYIVFVMTYWMNFASPLMPSVSDLMNAYVELWTKHDLFLNVWSSLGTIALSIGAMLTIGLTLAYLGTTPLVRPVVELLSKFRFLSLIGLTIFFSLSVGTGQVLKITTVSFSLGVYFLTAMADVIASVKPNQFNDAKVMKTSPWGIVYELIILGKSDETLEVLRQVAAMGWLMLTSVESQEQAGGGIGVLLFNANKAQRLDLILALQIMVIGFAFIQDASIRTLRDEIRPDVKLLRLRR